MSTLDGDVTSAETPAPSGAVEFTAFVHLQQRGLLRMAWLLTGDWPAAEDLVQSALTTAYQRWAQVAAAEVPHLYVRRMIVNAFLSSRRRRWHGEIPTSHLPDLSAPSADLELRTTLLRALDHLPARQRAVIALRYLDDLTEAQCALALGCSLGAVKAHAHKAMRTLRASPDIADLLNEGPRT